MAGDLSPISDFMNNNHSPAMDEVARKAAALTGAKDRFNIGLMSDVGQSGIKGKNLYTMGEEARKTQEYIGNQEFWASVIGGSGQAAGSAIGSGTFGNPFGGGGAGGGGTFSSPSSFDGTGLYSQPADLSFGFGGFD